MNSILDTLPREQLIDIAAITIKAARYCFDASNDILIHPFFKSGFLDATTFWARFSKKASDLAFGEQHDS
jgi:hypothetical protein